MNSDGMRGETVASAPKRARRRRFWFLKGSQADESTITLERREQIASDYGMLKAKPTSRVRTR